MGNDNIDFTQEALIGTFTGLGGAILGLFALKCAQNYYFNHYGYSAGTEIEVAPLTFSSGLRSTINLENQEQSARTSQTVQEPIPVAIAVPVENAEAHTINVVSINNNRCAIM